MYYPTKWIIFILSVILMTYGTTSATDYSTNAVGFWPMEDVGDETDESGNGSPLVESGGTIATSATKKFGTYSRYLDIADTEWFEQADGLSTDISGSSDFSIALWFRVDSLSGTTDQQLFAKYTTYLNQRQYRIYVNDDTDQKIYFVTSALGTSASLSDTTSTTTVVVDTWYHVVAVFEHSEASENDLKLYIDGSLEDAQDNANADVFNSTAPLMVGAYRYLSTPSTYMDGYLDDVAMFDTALSQTDVTAIFTYGIEGVGTPSSSYRPHGTAGGMNPINGGLQ